jgi:tRNA pseudouridine13 synthase
LITSERIRLNATSPIAGDLVYAEEKALEGQGEDGECLVESSCENLPTSITSPPTAKPVDFRGNVKRSWQTSSSVDVKVLKEEDLANYTIADVIIPMPGYEITYPEGKLFERYQEIMQTDGLDPLKMRRNQK